MTNSVSSTPKKTIPGIALVNALITKSQKMQLDKYQLAKEIGITYPYLCAISNGGRPVSGIDHKKLRAIAKFLGITFVQVLMLAEIVEPQDFLKDQNEELDRAMTLAMDSMRAHHEWGGVSPLPEEWAMLSQKTRVGIALMWQQVCGQTMLNQAQMVVLNKNKGEASSQIQQAA